MSVGLQRSLSREFFVLMKRLLGQSIHMQCFPRPYDIFMVSRRVSINPSEDVESAHGKAWFQAIGPYSVWNSVAEQCGCLTPHDCFDEHGHWFGEFLNYV